MNIQCFYRDVNISCDQPIPNIFELLQRRFIEKSEVEGLTKQGVVQINGHLLDPQIIQNKVLDDRGFKPVEKIHDVPPLMENDIVEL